MLQHRGNVGGQERLAVAQADHQRADPAHGDDPSRLLRAHDDQGVRPLGVRDGPPHGFDEVAVVFDRDEVGEELGVRVRRELVSGVPEAPAQLVEVLDDAVVDHDEPSGRVHVGMGVDVARLAVRRPPRVTDADGAVEGVAFEQRPEPGDLPLRLPNVDATVGHGDPGGVVAPVLESTQPVEDEGRGLPWADISHDSAHARRPPSSRDRRSSGRLRSHAETVSVPGVTPGLCPVPSRP